MNKKKAALLVWFIFTVFVIAVLACTPLAPVLLLEAAESLPVLLYCGLSSFVAIDLLVPNQRVKGSTSIVWLYWETLEHLALPLMFLAMSSIFSFFPFLFQAVVCTLLFTLYGFVFGEVRTGQDLFKVVVLVNLLLTFWSLPTLVFWIDYTYGVYGVLSWAVLSALTVLFYLRFRRNPSWNEELP